MFKKSRTKFYKWLRDANRDDSVKVEEGPQLKTDPLSNNLSSNAIHFKVFRGAGGIVVETCHSERNMQARDEIMLHVIPEGDDLATALAHIITLQSMRG